MAKAAATYECSSCGAQAPRWVGRCPRCQEFGTVAAVAADPRAPGGRRGSTASAVRAARPLSDVTSTPAARHPVGLGEFDRVLGGGLVPGQVVLVAGEPGVGKSTLLLWVTHLAAAGSGRPALYCSGEESAEQIGIRARRIGAIDAHVLVTDEPDLAAIAHHIEQHDPAVVVVDSVQTIRSSDVEGRTGGVAQTMEVTSALARIAKSRGVPLLLVGQSTKDSTVAGPRALEHLVDTVVTFEGDRQTSLRLLRTTKNRYGPADEVACFEQTDSGLAEVSDPSALFRGQREHPVSGTCVTVTVDGRRPLPAEIQALVTAEPNGRRGVTGLDSARVSMLVAVTDRYLSPSIAARDTYVATIGGARILDPAADLAVCLAVASSALGTPIPADVLAIGEVALSGDLRPVSMIGQRVAEAARCGYTRILVPPGSRSRIGGSVPSATVVELPHLQGAVERVAHLAARG